MFHQNWLARAKQDHNPCIASLTNICVTFGSLCSRYIKHVGMVWWNQVKNAIAVLFKSASRILVANHWYVV